MKLTKHKEALVIDYFVTNHDNRIPVISKALNLQETTVHQIINKYLDNKIKNIGRK